MHPDIFFRSLVAALRLKGIQFIVTRKDAHHRYWESVADTVTDERLPYLVPSPFTGRYADVDSALAKLQTGITSWCLAGGYDITLSTSRAQRILAELSGSDQALVEQAAALYHPL